MSGNFRSGPVQANRQHPYRINLAMSILFCTKNVLHRGKVLKKGFVRRGGTIFHGEDLSAVVLGGSMLALWRCEKNL